MGDDEGSRQSNDEGNARSTPADRARELGELRALVHDLPLAAAVLDVELRLGSHSRAWTALFAQGEPSLVGERYEGALERCAPLAAPMRAVLEDGQARRREGMVLRTLAGAQRLVDAEVRPWTLPSGEVGGVIVLLHDVTEASRERRELQRLVEELLQFNYRVSHDLLSPLKTVRGFIDLCEEELRDGNVDVVHGYHEIMRQNVIRLSTLVEDVLDLVRADVRQLERSEIDLGRLVGEIFHKHQLDIERAGVQVSQRCDGVTLYSERVRVLQVLENLVSNAIKYHHPDRRERRVSVEARAEADGGVVLVVRDNGIGFDESQSSAIFDIFRRATSKYPGSGLGLYIVKKHLDRLGGTVRVVSSRDDTIFEVSIPRASSARGERPR